MILCCIIVTGIIDISDIDLNKVLVIIITGISMMFLAIVAIYMFNNTYKQGTRDFIKYCFIWWNISIDMLCLAYKIKYE